MSPLRRVSVRLKLTSRNTIPHNAVHRSAALNNVVHHSVVHHSAASRLKKGEAALSGSRYVTPDKRVSMRQSAPAAAGKSVDPCGVVHGVTKTAAIPVTITSHGIMMSHGQGFGVVLP